MFRFQLSQLFYGLSLVALTAACVKCYWPDPLRSAVAFTVPWMIFNLGSALATRGKRQAFHVAVILFTSGTIAANFYWFGLPKFHV